MSSTLHQKSLLPVEPLCGRGTLYSLASNRENECLHLYTAVSESPETAARRFLRMHRRPFAGGGYAGRFFRAQNDCAIVFHYGNEAEFYYSLDRGGILQVFHYPFEVRCTLCFEGPWYDFVNAQGVSPEVLYRVPSIDGRSVQIMGISEQTERIKILDFLLDQEKSPERFKAYLSFVEACRDWVGGFDA